MVLPKRFGIAARVCCGVEFVRPQTGNIERRSRVDARTAIAPVMHASRAIGEKHTFHQRRRQRRRRDQNTRAEQAGPVHQARQRRQVGQVEIIEFVQHKIAAHEAQHRCDLPTGALAFRGRHQVVNRADKHRRGKQRTDSRIVHRLAEQAMLGIGTFVKNVPVLVDQRLRRSRATRFGFIEVILE